MAKSNKEKGLVIGGTVLGLLVGGSALAATHTSSDSGNQFFKYKDVKGSYTVAAHDKDHKCGDKKCGDKKCGDKDKKCGDKKCGDKDKKCGGEDKKKDAKKAGDKKCGEASCG